MRCSSCSAEASGGSRFCASCGEALVSSSAGTSSDVPTRLSPDSRRPRPSSGSRAGLLSSDSLADARFLPGTTVLLGTLPLSSQTIVSPNTITGIVPPSPIGPTTVDVTVMNTNGTAVLAEWYNYIPASIPWLGVTLRIVGPTK